jgi:rhomboid protease GluP
LVLNVAIYGLMLLKLGFNRFSPRDVADWGGLYVPLVLKGEIWRMLTANYLHFDFKHIVFNMIALLNWGPPVARHFGFWRFSLFYTIAGISGSIASFLFHPAAVCAGASGAASGILGALIAMRMMGDQSIQKSALLQAAVYNCVIPIVLPSVDWQAHLGGLLAGILMGFLLKSDRKVC